ncbi:MAG: hypothetical protein K0S71_2273 [Clostridia bacterium]|jgi:hypothetical protein|nr:hypothetical protein [Clostridia bacterium]
MFHTNSPIGGKLSDKVLRHHLENKTKEEYKYAVG